MPEQMTCRHCGFVIDPRNIGIRRVEHFAGAGREKWTHTSYFCNDEHMLEYVIDHTKNFMPDNRETAEVFTAWYDEGK